MVDLKSAREELGLTQAQLAALLGVSLRVVQSCEQGWRRPSANVERHLLLLLIASRQGPGFGKRACWKTLGCPAHQREACIAYRTRQGHLCWFLTGNMCHGRPCVDWLEKKETCEQCEFFVSLLQPEGGGSAR